MKPLLFTIAFLLLTSTASAQSFRYFDNRGNRFAGYSTPYGTAIVDPYGYRGFVQPFYRPVYPTYQGGTGWYGGWGQSGYSVPGGFVPMGYGWSGYGW